MKRLRVASDAKPNKRRGAVSKSVFAALDLTACLSSGPLPDAELARLLHFVPVFDEWKVANWGSSDVEMRVEIGKPAMVDDGPRPGRWSKP
jgi:hypothetical protein